MRATAPGPGGGTIDVDDERLAPLRARVPAAAGPPARLAFAAVHVVMRPGYAAVAHALDRPGHPDEIAEWLDLEATMALRRHVDAQGLGVAEAMDTAQRFALGWHNARRLIEACGALALRHGFIAGAGADHIAAVRGATDLVDAVVYQVHAIQAAGGMAILLPLPWLAQQRASPAEYVAVYRAIIAQCDGPLFVHWLGPMFQPQLEGYFPGDSFDAVMALAPDKVRGCKLSLLDADLERRVRRTLLPREQIVLTGDDWHFADLIAGDAPAITGRTRIGAHDVALGDFSHALLGVLDGVAVPAGLALRLLAAGDGEGFRAVMRPCERYGRVVFEPPTSAYKAGLAFTAWLNGLQEDYQLVNHEERARDREHYLRVAAAAAECGALRDAATAAKRLRAFAGEAR
ncbi:MAG TPA: DUF993 family protein [Planctomycetota bacterium]|nr:DUF993 family protein [Planctomycetota bacterium]